MKARLFLLLDSVRSSYWFIPSLMLLGAAALAVALVAADQHFDTEDLRGLWWIFSGGAEGARSLLSTVAGSVIAVAGTTFSITIAVLSLTSSQFGPRLLRGFLRDTGNQVVLGTFVATFLYCLLVLRMVRSVEEALFVPHIAVTGGVILAIASVCVLIYFIHHVSVSIQASRIIASVAGELEEAINRLFPDQIGQDGETVEAKPSSTPSSAGSNPNSRTVRATGEGYVQAIDGDALLALAREKDLVITLERAPGQFVIRSTKIATVKSGSQECSPVIPDIDEQVNTAFTFGEQRTSGQDMEFLLLELVEVATRALSPGTNDPFTAILCIDRIGASLCHLAERQIPSAARLDDTGTLRVIAKTISFEAIVETAFREIRHYGQEDPAVAQRLREVLDELGEFARTDAQRAAIRKEAAKAGTR
ncbi:MAG: DUF2254 domain-containing protein [Armatimonadota bacterium]